MAKTKVGATVEVEFKSIGEVRKAIKQATSDLIVMQEQFGKTSPQAIAAAKRIAELKDRIQDAKEQADLFDPGSKFKAFSNAASQVAGGFAAVQGAMALVGTESEDLQKTLVKVQGALALSQGLSQIGDLGKAFEELKVVAVNAFSTMRKAMMSIGIGVLVAGLGLIIANFDEFKKAVFRLIPGLETVTKFIGNLVQGFTDFIGVTSEAERNLDKFTKANDKANASIDNQIKILEAQGGKEEEIYKLRRQRIDNELSKLNESLKVKGKLSDEELKQKEDLITEQQVLDISERNRKKKLAEDEAKDAKEAYDKRRQQQREAYERERQQRLEFEEQQRQDWEAAAEEERNRDAIRLEEQEANFKKGVDLIAALTAQTIQSEADAIESARLAAEERTRVAQAEADARIQLAQVIGQGLLELSALAGSQTAIGKGLALAQIAIDTAIAISSLTRNSQANPANAPTGGIAGAVQFATGIVQILANINKAKQILSTANVPAKGGSSVPQVSGGGLAPVAATPTATVTAQALNAQAINNLSNQSTRAYVLNSDITNNEQRNAYLQRNARIG